MEDLGRLCADLPGRDRVAIARRLLTIVDGDGFGSSGALIQCLSEALGGEGRAELRETTETAIAALPEPNTDKSWQIDSWRRRLAHRLAILADLEGDVDRYIAALCQGGLERAYIADIAGRLITSGRPTEALEWLSRSTCARRGGHCANRSPGPGPRSARQDGRCAKSAVDILSKDVEHRILARLSEAAARL